MQVPVWFYCPNPRADARGSWDQALLEQCFAGGVWRPPFFPQYELRAPNVGEGAIVIIPGQHVLDYTATIARVVRDLPWALTIVTSDEEQLFPLDVLARDSTHAVWNQYHVSSFAERLLPLGAPPGTRPILRDSLDAQRHYDWFFAGQATHERRTELVEALTELNKTERVAMRLTDGFAQGTSRETYLRRLAHSKLAPAPSGYHSLDSFRLYEALEAGCLPIVETHTPDGAEPGIWFRLFGDPSTGALLPIPIVDDWHELPDLELGDIELGAARAGALWRQTQRRVAQDLADTVASTGDATVADLLTICITTSPTELDADAQLEMIERTIRSIRAYPELADAELLIICDGIRPEQARRTDEYHRYVHSLVQHAQLVWTNICPYVLPEWAHQAGALRELLTHVVTPLTLFVEHDTPLTGDPIDWTGCVDTVLTGELYMLRFHYQPAIAEQQRHTLIDGKSIARITSQAGVEYVRTRQWSQRPHLAQTAWYRSQLETYFAQDARSMVEDVMHGVVDHYFREYGEPGWNRFKLGIYAPADGTMQRTTHLDGRGDEPKYPMRFSYPAGGTPEGAPRSTDERIAEALEEARRELEDYDEEFE